MRFNSGFIGHIHTNQTFEFGGGDTLNFFMENAKTQPPEWYYHTTQIQYSYNEFGHRAKPLSALDTSNYILFTGCSHTESVGVREEHSYPRLVSSGLGCDYYNLGLGSTNVDILLHNLIVWRNKVKELPKALVIQWPIFTRFSTVQQGNILNHNPSTESTPDMLKYMVLGEEIGVFNARYTFARTLIDELYPCKVIHVSFEGSPPHDYDALFTRIDYARDLSHPGLESHLALSSAIISRFS